MGDELDDDFELLGFDSDGLLWDEEGEVAGHHLDGLGDLWLGDVGLGYPWCEHEELSLLGQLL